MREIKFRAFCNLHDVMIPEYCVLKDFNFEGYDLTNNRHSILDVMQFTGLYDNKGIEIYEADIIEITERRYFFGYDKGLQTIRFRSVVRYEDAGFVFSTKQENDSPLFSTDNIRVLGNIYQNANLIGL